MNREAKIASHIAAMAAALGINEIIYAPGSRSAPLVLAFHRTGKFKEHILVDERAAAFFALGMAIQQRKPVVLVCTSGTAALNFSPAISEAFFRKIPLLILTADRPEEWIGQYEGQAIYQQQLYGKHVKASFHLEGEIKHTNYISYIERVFSEGFHQASEPGNQGPVHFNISFREPLYEVPAIAAPRVISRIYPEQVLPATILSQLISILSQSQKIAVLAGQDTGYIPALDAFCRQTGAVVFAEPLANTGLDSIHYFGEAMGVETLPELVIYIGGQVINKRWKQQIRESKIHTWRIDPSGSFIDTYRNLETIIQMTPTAFFEQLALHIPPVKETTYRAAILVKEQQITRTIDHFFKQDLEGSDLLVYKEIYSRLPENIVLHVGNSTPVRYTNLLAYLLPKGTHVECNRGTSGIDGSTSTAAGFAAVDSRINLLITGDLAFQYDNNGLWNKALPGNLRIIIINNQGGNIFRLIEGPRSQPELSSHFEVHTEHEFSALAQHWNIPYQLGAEYALQLDWLLDPKANECRIVEIPTLPEISAHHYQALMETVKDQID